MEIPHVVGICIHVILKFADKILLLLHTGFHVDLGPYLAVYLAKLFILGEFSIELACADEGETVGSLLDQDRHYLLKTVIVLAGSHHF
jgi:hypothetical protein